MQPIERYGVVALLFLIVTIGAVVLWDRSEDGAPGDNEVAAAERNDELAGLSRQRGNQPRLPADPKGSQVRRGEAAKRHQAGSTPAGLEVQDGSWVRDRQQPSLAVKPEPKPEPRNEPALFGGGQPAPGPKGGAAKVEPRQQPKASQGSGLAGGLVQPKPRPEPKPQVRTYTVASGDTMGQIAQDQLGSIKHLKALQTANPEVRPERMSVGTVLVLPEVAGAGDAVAKQQPQPTPAKAQPAPAPSGRTHTVAEGESLWSIAEARLGSGNRYTELQTLNPSAGSTLKVGQVLRLPEGAGLAASKPAEAVAKAETQPRRKRGVVR